MSADGWIYYVKAGSLIKIGWSGDPKNRISSYGSNRQLLALHPGTREEEMQIHRSLAAYVDRGREWYRDTEEVRQVATRAVRKWGEPQMPPSALRLITLDLQNPAVVALTQIAAALEQAEAKRMEILQQRRDMVREVREAGTPVTAIAAALGISRQQAHTLLTD